MATKPAMWPGRWWAPLALVLVLAGPPVVHSIGTDLQALVTMGVIVQQNATGPPSNSSSCGVALALAQGSLSVVCDVGDGTGVVQELHVVGPASFSLVEAAVVQLTALQVGALGGRGPTCCSGGLGFGVTGTCPCPVSIGQWVEVEHPTWLPSLGARTPAPHPIGALHTAREAHGFSVGGHCG